VSKNKQIQSSDNACWISLGFYPQCNCECRGAHRSEVTLFWGGFGTIKIKYRLNNSTFRYGN